MTFVRHSLRRWLAVAIFGLCDPMLAQAQPGSATRPAHELSPAEPVYHFQNMAMVRFPRRYLVCSPQAVARAVELGVRADVHFVDRVRETDRSKDLSAGGYRMGFTIYNLTDPIFVTEQGLYVSVPQIHYAAWLKNAIQHAGQLKPGDTVVVEGTTYGKFGPLGLVTAERLLMPNERSAVKYHLRVNVTGVEKPLSEITTVGDHVVELPADANGKRSDPLRFKIEEMPQSRLCARLKALRFGGSAVERKTYAAVDETQAAELVAQGGGQDVAFTAMVRTIGIAPAEYANIKTPTGGSVAISARLISADDIQCLLPMSNPTLIERATRTIPGQTVIYEGTLLPTSTNSAPVLLIDDYRYVGVQGTPEDVPAWLVELVWPDGSRNILPGPGTYRIQLSGMDATGKQKILTITFSETREIESLKQ